MTTTLSGLTEARLRNQLGRAFRQTFGAEEGLCELVTLATLQMLAAGSSREAIRRALAQLVSDHPEAGARQTAGAARADTLCAEMLRWSDRTAPKEKGR